MIRLELSQGREGRCSLTPTEDVITVSVGETPIHCDSLQSVSAALVDNGKSTILSSSPVQEKTVSNGTRQLVASL